MHLLVMVVLAKYHILEEKLFQIEFSCKHNLNTEKNYLLLIILANN